MNFDLRKNSIHPDFVTNLQKIFALDSRRDMEFTDLITEEDLKNHTTSTGNFDQDYNCFSFGNAVSVHFHPDVVQGVNPKALALYYGSTTFYDNALHFSNHLTKEELWGTRLCGKTMEEWINELFTEDCKTFTQESQTAVKEKLKYWLWKMVEYIIGRRDGVDDVDQVYKEADPEKYFRSRDQDGCFSGVLVGILAAYGVDYRAIPEPVFWSSAKAAILSFDLHGHMRHSAEHESYDTVNFFQKVFKKEYTSTVTLLLDKLKVLYNSIVKDKNLSRDAKRALTIFPMGFATVQYHSVRYYRGTSLHIEPKQVDNAGKLWSHVGSSKEVEV